MACWDSHVIYAQDWNDDRVYGHISNEYPGCGCCSHCVWSNDHDRERIRQHQDEQQAWLRNNPNRYQCAWTSSSGASGAFTFNSSTLEAAREVAQRSVYEWASLLVSSK